MFEGAVTIISLFVIPDIHEISQHYCLSCQHSVSPHSAHTLLALSLLTTTEKALGTLLLHLLLVWN